MQVYCLGYETNDVLCEDRKLCLLCWWDLDRLVVSEDFFNSPSAQE